MRGVLRFSFRLLFALVAGAFCWPTGGPTGAESAAISPHGPNYHPGVTGEIDEMPGTEGYDAETGYMMPNKKCIEMQSEIQEDCETGAHLATDDDAKSCDRKRAKWMAECVFGD